MPGSGLSACSDSTYIENGTFSTSSKNIRALPGSPWYMLALIVTITRVAHLVGKVGLNPHRVGAPFFKCILAVLTWIC